MYLCRDVGIKLGLGLTTGKVRWVGLYVSCDLVPFFRVGTRHVGTRYGGASMLTKVRSMREREREREECFGNDIRVCIQKDYRHNLNNKKYKNYGKIQKPPLRFELMTDTIKTFRKYPVCSISKIVLGKSTQTRLSVVCI